MQTPQANESLKEAKTTMFTSQHYLEVYYTILKFNYIAVHI